MKSVTITLQYRTVGNLCNKNEFLFVPPWTDLVHLCFKIPVRVQGMFKRSEK